MAVAPLEVITIPVLHATEGEIPVVIVIILKEQDGRVVVPQHHPEVFACLRRGIAIRRRRGQLRVRVDQDREDDVLADRRGGDERIGDVDTETLARVAGVDKIEKFNLELVPEVDDLGEEHT